MIPFLILFENLSPAELCIAKTHQRLSAHIKRHTGTNEKLFKALNLSGPKQPGGGLVLSQIRRLLRRRSRLMKYKDCSWFRSSAQTIMSLSIILLSGVEILHGK